jgi:hypothetical protein
VEAVWLTVAAVLLLIAFIAEPRTRRWWPVAVPLLVPLALAGLGAYGQITTDSSDCYEECGYVWLYLYAVVTLVPAAIASAVIAVGIFVARRGRTAAQRR